MTHYQTLCEALLLLAGLDPDRADLHNDVGFNGRDTIFGHSLAETVRSGKTLTPIQQQAAIKMLQTYRNTQLAHLHLPTPAGYQMEESGQEKPTSILDSDGEQITVAFPNPGLRQLQVLLVKGLAGRRYDPDAKIWTLPAHHKQALIAMFPQAQRTPAFDALTESAAPATRLPAKRIIHDKDRLVITFPYDPELVEKVKSLPERKFDPKSRQWSAPERLATDVLKMFPDFAADAAVHALVEKQQTLAEKANQATSEFTVPTMPHLYPFQRAGVEFLELAQGRAILADEMGLGKTIMACAYLELHPELRPALIVVPASLKLNWEREIYRWMTQARFVYLIDGTKPYTLPPADIYVINYDLLTPWLNTLLALKATILIGDELHYAKNTKAQRTKALQKLAKAVPQVIGLTGTPITNRPQELWPLLNLVAPHAWPSFFPFAKRYCAAHHDGWGWRFEGASNLAELHEQIKPYVVRRTKAQVLSELPAKQRTPLVVELPAAARKNYDALLHNAIVAVKEARATRKPVGTDHLALIEKAKQAAVVGKLPQACTWIRDFLDTGEKLVVFATHHATVDALMNVFGDRAVKLTGRENTTQRQNAVDRFQNDDSVRLFVGNIRAAGVGITLTAASNVLFLELDWTPGAHSQAEDRTHRIGQTDSVTAYYMLAENTIDEDIYRLLESKRQIVDTVTDGTPSTLEFSLLNTLADILEKGNDDE